MAETARPRGVLARVRDLRLFWKLLIPFLLLMLILGVLGAFLIVRDLAARAQTQLDVDLSRRSLDAAAAFRNRELYLIESVNFAANIEGMPETVEAGDRVSAARLLQSVLALKTDLNLLAVTVRGGTGLVEFAGATEQELKRQGAGTRWSAEPFVAQALRDRTGSKWAGVIEVGGAPHLGISAPICASPRACVPVGAAIAAIRMDTLAREATTGTTEDRAPRAGAALSVSVYGVEGRLLASSGPRVPRGSPPLVSQRPVRRTQEVAGAEVATLYTPLEVQDRRAGTLAATVPTAPAFASVRGTALRLVLILLAAMIAVVGLGALLTRFILGQVRPLVASNRALGRGDYSARATVLGNDELGELAAGFNQMAEQLQASYETLELRVAQRTEEVQRLLQQRTEFFAGISHELRTPLFVISGHADIMLDPKHPKRGKWSVEFGRTIKDQAQHLQNLVNDILNFASAEAGRMEVSLEDLRLPDVVRALRGTIEGLARTGDLHVSIDVPADLPVVRADRTRLREIILNLVDNSVKYTPPGGRVSLAAAAADGAVEISVSDTGVGIPKDAGDRIFEPFYRVKGTEAQRGQASSGLGLALTKRLVEAQGGTIGFESEPGAGTTFRFTLLPAGGDGERARRRRSSPPRRARRG